MRSAALLSLLALAACATGNTASVAAPGRQESVRIANTGANTSSSIQVVADNAAPVTTAIAAPIDVVWSALSAVYDSLAIPVTTRDAMSHTIGNSSLKLRRRLGTVRLSQFLDCGSTQGGPSADSYDMLISLVSSAQATGAGTLISTQLSAQGRPVAFAGEYVNCSSNGTLEKQVTNRVKLIVK